MRKRLGILGMFILVLALAGCTSLFHVPSAVTQLKPSNPGMHPPTDASFLPRIDGEYTEGQVIVGYEDATALQQLTARIGGTVVDTIPQLRVALVQLPVEVEVPRGIAAINRASYHGDLSGIRYVEPNYCDAHPIEPIPADETSIKSLTPEVYNNNDDLRSYQWGLDAVDASEAWRYARGDGIIIGVIDSGVDGGHPDLQGQVINKWYDAWNTKWVSGLDSSWNPQETDPSRYRGDGAHGTHVAGIIAAKDDGKGIVGLAPHSRILSVRIFSPDSNRNSWGYVGDFGVAKGIVAAVDYGANVLSNSWGGKGYSATLKSAIDYALTHRVVFVAAMMNTSKDEVEYPAAYPGVIAVGATTPHNERADFSTTGGWISVGAPGEGILSCLPRWWEQDGTGNELLYDYWEGTSMATPFVSALAALVLEEHPTATPYQVKKIIEDTATDIESPGFDRDTGYGLINAARAVTAGTPAVADGGTLHVDVKASDGKPVPNMDITLRENGIDRYFGQTNQSGVGTFIGIEPGTYEVLVGGQDMLNMRGRIANRVTATDVVNVEEGTRQSVNIVVDTQLKVTLTWSDPVNLDLGVDVYSRDGKHIGYFTSKTECPYGVFTSNSQAGGKETFTLTDPHVSGIYYLVIDASNVEYPTKITPVTVTVTQNGIVEQYGPYTLSGGARYYSYDWAGWWDTRHTPSCAHKPCGLGGPLVY